MATLPPGWEAQLVPDGRTYYVDHNTKQTQWHPPQAAQAALETIMVTPPASCQAPGSQVQVAHQGRNFIVTVPAGFQPGQPFPAQIPAPVQGASTNPQPVSIYSIDSYAPSSGQPQYQPQNAGQQPAADSGPTQALQQERQQQQKARAASLHAHVKLEYMWAGAGVFTGLAKLNPLRWAGGNPTEFMEALKAEATKKNCFDRKLLVRVVASTPAEESFVARFGGLNAHKEFENVVATTDFVQQAATAFITQG